MQKSGAIIVAGGSGERCGGALPKQFHLLGGLPVLARTINLFARALPAVELVVVLPRTHIAFWKDLAARFEVAAHTVAEGGAERSDSVRSGLAALSDRVELIAVHDGVRPLATPELIRRTVAAAAEHGAAIPVTEPVDSLRETDGAHSQTIDRRRLRIVQTPQVFRAEVLRTAYGAVHDGAFTDDASVVEQAGYPLLLTPGERTNLKITTQDDFILAEAILSAREEKDQADADHL